MDMDFLGEEYIDENRAGQCTEYFFFFLSTYGEFFLLSFLLEGNWCRYITAARRSSTRDCMSRIEFAFLR